MFDKISHQRKTLYIILFCLIPLLFVFSNLYSKKNILREMKTKIEKIEQLIYVKESKGAANMAVRNHYKNADHFYIDKHIETLSFLHSEIDQLERFAKDHPFFDRSKAEKRQEFLSKRNRLVFTEGIVQTYPFYQETMESQLTPIQVNADDIKRVLARIEGVKIGPFESGPNRPQLLVTEFKMKRLKEEDFGESFSLNMKLLRREYL